MATTAETNAPARRDPQAIENALRALAARFGNRVVTSRAVRQQHGNTVTWIENQPPDAVVFPQSTEDVQEIVRICGTHRVPIIPFGVGTSLEGHVNAPQGGVSIVELTPVPVPGADMIRPRRDWSWSSLRCSRDTHVTASVTSRNRAWSQPSSCSPHSRLLSQN